MGARRNVEESVIKRGSVTLYHEYQLPLPRIIDTRFFVLSRGRKEVFYADFLESHVSNARLI